MKLSTRIRYASRALAELGLVYPAGTRSVRDVAETLQVSAKYLEHIVRALRAAGLINTVRGTQGGCALAKPPESITLKDLFEAMDGPLTLVDCVVHGSDACSMVDSCPTRDTWIEINEAVLAILERTTVQDLAERKARKAAASTAMYYI